MNNLTHNLYVCPVCKAAFATLRIKQDHLARKCSKWIKIENKNWIGTDKFACAAEAWGPGHDEHPFGPEGPCKCAREIYIPERLADVYKDYVWAKCQKSHFPRLR